MITVPKKQKFGIWGLGKTGISVYEELQTRTNQVEIIVYDDYEKNREMFATLFGKKHLIPLSDLKWQNLNHIVLSPGIPLEHEIVKFANFHAIPIISDIDLLFEKSVNSNFIAVTGTNGKSTSTALISHILNANNLNYPAVGNIGVPALKADSDTASGYVLELSSFQLDLIKTFTAKIAVLLNITPDHLDRHKNMSAYIAAKRKIFDRMNKENYAIINIDNNYCKKIFVGLTNQENIILIPFSVRRILEKGISIIGNKIYDKFFGDLSFALPFNENLQGLHNYENIAASYAATKIIGLESYKILEAIKQFQGLPHRMQYIGCDKEGNNQQINFYNDSKATNAIAASQSIKALDNIYWLAGGIAKEGGIEEIKPLFYKIKKAYFFGQAKEDFAHVAQDILDFMICEDLEEAFSRAYEDACADLSDSKNILLAPACSSYDQFKNFEERGELFIRLCQEKI